MAHILEIKNIHVAIDGKEVVRDVSLRVPQGSVVALMGPNGSGKSSLVNAVMGHPRYKITGGHLILDKEDITNALPHEKAQKGIFLSLQNPPSLPGITVSSFLRNAFTALTGSAVPVLEFQKRLEEEMASLGMEKELAGRHVNEGFSGGEKKRLEALQLALFKPKFALLDETDAGLDVDALRTVAETIKRASAGMGILLITHYTRILQYLVPDEVHVMREGTITRSGGKELAEEIEKQGYK
ncbi:MAG: FeS assembly ATPase SufC [Parcubacteria group bacterium Gr01-1014_70]|nr:MAG: FeS assembly ATPase SufC [Parcubacteria group bacterium Gr01-1014_70]